MDAGTNNLTPTLLRRALKGESFVLDSDAHTLHELTQLALALRPDAHLTIRRADTMSPLERASICSVGQGRVVFA